MGNERNDSNERSEGALLVWDGLCRKRERERDCAVSVMLLP